MKNFWFENHLDSYKSKALGATASLNQDEFIKTYEVSREILYLKEKKEASFKMWTALVQMVFILK